MKHYIFTGICLGISMQLSAGYIPASSRYGDIDQDGLITEKDVALVKDHIQGIRTISDPEKLSAADIDRDNAVTEDDLALIQESVAGKINIGCGTFYDADESQGNCSFPAIPGNDFTCAMNVTDYNNAQLCGAYVEVTGPDGSVTLRVTNKLPEGNPGDIDLAEKIFHHIADPIIGRVPIRWKIVDGNVTGPVTYQFKDGSSVYWTEIQVRNHRYPIKKFEYLKNGNYIEIARRSYNYFVEESGLGNGPYTFRVTDIYDQVIIDSNIALKVSDVNTDIEVPGTSQFPAILEPGDPGPQNTPPICANVVGTTLPNQSVTVSLSGSDNDGDEMDFSIDTQPQHGSINLVETQLTYTPDSGFSGLEQFTYIASDAFSESSPATISIHVMNSNREQEFDLRKGYNLVSFSVTPANQNMEQLFETTANEIEFIRDGENAGSLNTSQGYLIKAGKAVKVAVNGPDIPVNKPFELTIGKNVVPYILPIEQNATKVFAPIFDNLKYIKDQDGLMLRKVDNKWINNIGNLKPGQSYVIELHKPVTFSYLQ